MADGGITLDIDLKDAKLIAGLLRAAGAQKQFTKEIDKTKAEAAKAEKELDRMAANVKKMTATPLEKYNTELAKLNTLQQRGKITADEYSRAMAMQKSQLDSATVGMQKLGAAAAKTRSGKDAIVEIASSMGLITNASGAATMAIRLVTDALAKSNDKVREAKQLLDEMEDPFIDLNAVSASPQEFQNRMNRIAKGAAQEGVSEKSAAKVMLDMIGAGTESEFEAVLSARRGVMNSAGAGEVVSKLMGLFPDQVKNAEQALNLFGTATASEGTRDTPGAALQGLPKAAIGGQSLGASVQSTLATYTAVSDAMGGAPAISGDRLNTFGSKLKMRGFRGDFVDVMAQLRAMPETDREKILKEDLEINNAYDFINANEEKIRKRTAELANTDGYVANKKAQWGGNATTRSIQDRAEAESQRAVILKQTRGVMGEQAAGLRANVESGAMLSGSPALQYWAPYMADAYSTARGLFAGGKSPDPATDKLNAAADKLNAAADKLSKAASGQKNRALNVEAAQQAN
jgi:hypothetical protein